jgi:hypothetical protein
VDALVDMFYQLQKTEDCLEFTNCFLELSKKFLRCSQSKLVWVQKDSLFFFDEEGRPSTVGPEEGITGECLRTKKSMIVLNMLTSPLFSQKVDLESHLPVAVFPIISPDSSCEEVVAVAQLPLFTRNLEAEDGGVLNEGSLGTASEPALENHRAFAKILAQLIPQMLRKMEKKEKSLQKENSS